MSNISMVEARLPAGFRFHPRDEELVCDYLLNKINNSDSHNSLLLIDVDLNKCEPWDIPERACVGGKEWYFYSQRDRKYATGVRTNRATSSGYWKATGKDRGVFRKGNVVGMRKTLVFYKGRAPKGTKTDWVMHEFRLHPPLSNLKEDWVLCRVFYKKREEVEKGSSTTAYDIDTSSYSILPPLMDSSYITFDQTHPNLLLDSQQVPCFSIFSHNQPQFQNFNQFHPSSNKLNNITTSFPQLPITPLCPNFDDNNINININDFSSDKKVIKAFLDQLNKVDYNSSTTSNNNVYEYGSPSLGNEATSESYLSEKLYVN